MINILSYVGMSIQNELCLWTLLGLIRTIFDATLFKVNANLKQVWHMNMPPELSMPVQRVLRTMISGVMLVQCFTVYVYLATYIVLLYPVFLEERPTLVLPWLLLAAVRKLLCELTSLALGLGTCVLLGPAKPPCIKFLVIKMTTIVPAFYMWLLMLSYYHSLKMTSTFKTRVLAPSIHDYGLEMAIRRRRTKSLQDEEQLRNKLIASFYGERPQNSKNQPTKRRLHHTSCAVSASDDSYEDTKNTLFMMTPLSNTSHRYTMDSGSYEDWFGSEVVMPRDTDRVLEQLGLMLLRCGAYLNSDGADPVKLYSAQSHLCLPKPSHEQSNLTQTSFDSDPPTIVGNQGKTASYLSDYPQIFNKKSSDLPFSLQSDHAISSVQRTRESIVSDNINKSRKYSMLSNSAAKMALEEKLSQKKDNSTQLESSHNETVEENSKILINSRSLGQENGKDPKNLKEFESINSKQESESTSTDSLKLIIEKNKQNVLEECHSSKISLISERTRPNN